MEMVELRVQADAGFVKRLKDLLSITANTDLVSDALTILSWAGDESQKGRVILSAQPDGTDVERLAMPRLTQLRQKRR